MEKGGFGSTAVGALFPLTRVSCYETYGGEAAVGVLS